MWLHCVSECVLPVSTTTTSFSYKPAGAMLPEAIPFQFLDASDLTVTHVAAATGVRTAMVLGIGYVVSGDGPSKAGKIAAAQAWPGNDLFLVERRTALVQKADVKPHEAVPAVALTETLDRTVMAAQERDAATMDLGARALTVLPGQSFAAINKADFAGQFFAGGPTGDVVPASGTGNDPALRTDLASSVLGSTLVAWKAAGIGAVARTLLARLKGLPGEPEDYGAVGDGITDDLLALTRCVAAHRRTRLREGARYFVSAPVLMLSGRSIEGGGKSSWEPYTGVGKPATYKTEIVVDGTDALDARLTFSVAVKGIGFCSETAAQSGYRADPGFQELSGGIAITGSSQFEASDVSFFGLQYGVHSHANTESIPGAGSISGVETEEDNASANTTQMASISDWQASDCAVVFQFGNADSAAYTVRDARISNQVIALHCGSIVEAHWYDGLRLETLRLYQCTGYTLDLRAGVFLNMVATTVFENAQIGVRMRQCENSAIAGITTARTGFYAVPAPGYPQRSAFSLSGCITTKIEGIIEKPTGSLIDIDGCFGTTVSIAGDTPYWLTGNATNASGAINVTNSVATNLSGTITGEGHFVNVWADWFSQRTLRSTIVGTGATGSVRAYDPKQDDTIIVTLPADVGPIAAGGVSDPIAQPRVFIPAGKKLKARSVQQTSPIVQLRTVVAGNAVIWNTVDEAVGQPPVVIGSISLEDKVLYDNSAGPDGYFYPELTLRNPPGGGALTIQRGHEVRISTVIV